MMTHPNRQYFLWLKQMKTQRQRKVIQVQISSKFQTTYAKIKRFLMIFTKQVYAPFMFV